MIVIKLWGGVCNQLFQYAFGYALAKKHNDTLIFDTEFYNKQPGNCGKREMLLEKYFKIERLDLYKRTVAISILQNRVINRLIRYGNFTKFNLPGQIMYFKEKPGVYHSDIPYEKGKINYYDGYWQTEEYFKEYASELREIFSPNDTIRQALQDMKSDFCDDSVALHVRRGDYLNSKNMIGGYSNYDMESYYLSAIDLLKEKLVNPKFYIISDDIAWCRGFFDNSNGHFAFVENSGKEGALMDLLSISKCKHGIMSPSTFSWWGNWFRSDSSDSIVVAPKGYYLNERFLLESWLKI